MNTSTKPLPTAPAWLLDLIKKPKSQDRGAHRREGSTIGLDSGGPILEGVRNQTLFFIALEMKDSGKGRGEALGELLDVNEARCAPPLAVGEVEAIVKSAFRYPIRGKRTPPEVLEALGELKRAWWVTAWRGVGGKSERDILRVLIQWAERYGHLIPAGVRISISWRDLAIAAGCKHRTVARVVKRLRLAGWLRGDNAQRVGTDAGAFVLLPRLTDTTQSMARGRSVGDAESGDTLSRLPVLTPCFRWRGFVGKGKAGALYVLEVFGPQSLEELAERLGYSRPRDLRRLYLEPLAMLGLIEDRGGVYALPDQARYVKRVQEIRAARIGGGPHKVRSKDRQGRWVTRVIEVSPRSEIEREEADALDHEKDRHRYRDWLAGRRSKADPTPERTTAELERVPDPDPGLGDALREYLRRNPHRRDEPPSWLSVALWADEYLETKPPPAAVEVALADLRGAAA
jgi:primase-like protein